MQRLLASILLLFDVICLAQQAKPSQRVVPALAVHGASRLVALARVGALTNTSLMVEAGDMHLLQAPVFIDMGQTTMRDAH